MKYQEPNHNFIEWPELNFSEMWDYTIENKSVNLLYKSLLFLLFTPQIVIRAFIEILRFKA